MNRAPAIQYLTEPEPVSMGDAWFEIASLSHFWILRRFEVLKSLVPDLGEASSIGEIGCGNGLVQAQVEQEFGLCVDGFDLNETALKASVVQRSARFCYNILTRAPALADKYDVLFLFDVIEHIDDAPAFIDAAAHHVRPGGRVVFNVPADPNLFSEYDRAAGHVRRYTAESLRNDVERGGLRPGDWTYWGAPMVPLLVWRKRRLKAGVSGGATLRNGFQPPGSLANAALLALSRMERLPNHQRGTSLMMVATK